MKNNRFSREITVFHGRQTPEKGILVGYGALIEAYMLPVPLPAQLAIISEKRRQYSTQEWKVFTSRHQPVDTLYNHLVFAIKYEGINLLFFKKLFASVDKTEVKTMIQNEPLGQYSRRIWFLYEWLYQTKLDIPDLQEGNYVTLLDDALQFVFDHGSNSSRHRIKNNLPGNIDFCPLIHRTEKIDHFIQADLSALISSVINSVHKDILLRTSAFLLLKDSKASFSIEGETPTQTRAIRWGKAIGQAGTKPLTKEELLRLQKTVIDNSRFVTMGFRKEGGFVGEHDRNTGEPIPDHISAKWQDLETLIKGLLETNVLLEKSVLNPVLTAAMIAFGFVFIHPFEDGNGRIHRYLFHHILAKMKFTPQGIIFPVSTAILEHIDDYRKVLENYSHPVLEFIHWRKTKDNNVEVLNDTIDYYRYFDATRQAEFLFECIEHTIETTIPNEVAYLYKYDVMKTWLDEHFQMPDKLVNLLIRFLEQNNGTLSQRAKTKEFSELTEEEIEKIEKSYLLYFKT